MNIQSPDNLNYYLKIIIELGENLIKQKTVVEQRDYLVLVAQRLFNADVNLWILDFMDSSLNGKESQSNTNSDSLSPLMSAALKHKCICAGNSVHLSDQSDTLISNEPTQIIKYSSTVTCAAVPLSYQGFLFGVLQVNRTAENEFLQYELELLHNFSNQTSFALYTSRQVSDERQLELLSLVQSVSAQISDILDIDLLSSKVTQLILNTFKFYYVAIFTLDEGASQLTFRASARPSSGTNTFEEEDETQLPTFNVQLGQGIIGNVAQSGTEIIANDVKKDFRYREIDVLHETKSEAALPLIIETRLLGVLDVQSNKSGDFGTTDIMVLRALADNIANAVESARLIREIQIRATQLSVVAEISNAITSILDLDELLKEVVTFVHKILGYPYVRIFSVHPGRRKIFYQAGNTSSGIVNLNEENSIELDDDKLPISQVARNGKKHLFNIVDKGVDNKQNQSKSGLFVPLIFVDETIGILELHSEKIDAFKQEELNILDSLADNIAIAMRNANLYRSELWRRRVAESMREVTSLLTSNTATDQVLKFILLELEKALPCDIAAIWLIEDNQDEIPPQLRLADVHLTRDYLHSFGNQEGSLTTREVQKILTQSVLPSPWLLTAINSPEPKIRRPDDPYEPLGAILDFASDYSAVAAPLLLTGKPFGILVLSHHTNGRYGHEAQGMTETFANYAAVAIENTRLYQTAHDQAWVSTVLLQVSEATQSVSTLDELLTTLVRLTPMLLGVNSCSVFLWDNSADVFNPTASFGLLSVQLDEFYSHKIHLGEIPCFDQLFLAKGPVFVNRETANAYFSTFDLGSKVLVLFPMISHNDVLGAFLIDYDLYQNQTNLEHITRQIDWEQKYSIIQGIAHQAAIAVENIRLIKSQQDEAYVSIALLQVAQAIVSLNALDEILETIVRITPILVGVKRSIIFIWDSSNQTFKLMKSYGVNRTDLHQLEKDFTSEEFPLLNVVRNSNSIVYQELDEPYDSPLTWVNFESMDFDFIETENYSELNESQFDIPVDGFIGKDHLRASKGLLYGFPLAVKGIVLGVLLTQERELPEELPSRQIREKRLEISIGISQQAAMAIQNDLLQREVVERERLEREFQLARSIQQTFLPESLPKLDRWELFCLWRPARQVSGDFYDIIPLKDDKWGLVIADVADKGMPAALYMTLIRTLIRATANDEDDSPSSVLRRVNDLLVADSKSGMFVTIVYGVLSVKSNTLDYANAGHNPPLVLRSNSKRLQKLPGTGMAMGIFEGIEIHQNTIRIKPGDCVVFYTDGITEAFSPQDLMYGEKRLKQVIRNSTAPRAEELAQAIDKSVTSFIDDGSSTDDITMLILKRLT